MLTLRDTLPGPLVTNSSGYGWHFQYLTIIGLTISTLTFSAALIGDLIQSPQLFRLKTLLSSSSLPLSALITTLYWSLRAIDPALVVPPDLELPFVNDISFHLTPTVVLLIDLLLLSPPWTLTFGPAALLSATIAFAYWGWVELCYSHNGFYPYPLFALLNTAQRVVLFAGCAIAMAGMTVALSWLYSVVNGVEADPVGTGEKGKAV